jgi:type VI secretion system protein ImpF
VLRDLEWLLNAGCRPFDDELHEYPLVARSVVNYGMPDLAGLTASGLTRGRVEKMVDEAIKTFEPRIVASSLSVRAVQGEGETEGGAHVGFEIAGELCPLPMPEALFVRTELDLETGRCEVREGD